MSLVPVWAVSTHVGCEFGSACLLYLCGLCLHTSDVSLVHHVSRVCFYQILDDEHHWLSVRDQVFFKLTVSLSVSERPRTTVPDELLHPNLQC